MKSTWFIETESLITIRQKAIARSSRSFLKIMSYYGAIRVPFDYPVWAYLAWKDQTGRYIDPGNRVYAEVFRACWPCVLYKHGLSNEESIGDWLEALLGIAWLRDFRGLALPAVGEDVRMMLEKAIFAQFLLKICE